MVLVSIVAFTAGVVMLVRAKRVLHHSSQPPPTGTDHYEMMDKGEKRAPFGAGVYEEVDKQDTQTDGCTRHYQELDPARWSIPPLQFNLLVVLFASDHIFGATTVCRSQHNCQRAQQS